MTLRHGQDIFSPFICFLLYEYSNRRIAMSSFLHILKWLFCIKKGSWKNYFSCSLSM